MSTLSFPILKADGQTADFSEEKLAMSLRKNGASEATINQVLRELESNLYRGISTKKIYRTAYKILRTISTPIASKYRLKEAVMALGPTGYPFEQLVAHLFRKDGFETVVGQTYQGKCISHEVDVWATTANEGKIVECKFRNKPGYKSDIKVSLYFHARFNDLVQALSVQETSHRTYRGCLATNAKFTDDAYRYAECSGLELMSWDKPKGRGVIHRLEQHNLLPISVLSTLSKNDYPLFLNQDIVFCSELFQRKEFISTLPFADRKLRSLEKELQRLEEAQNLY